MLLVTIFIVAAFHFQNKILLIIFSESLNYMLNEIWLLYAQILKSFQEKDIDTRRLSAALNFDLISIHSSVDCNRNLNGECILSYICGVYKTNVNFHQMNRPIFTKDEETLFQKVVRRHTIVINKTANRIPYLETKLYAMTKTLVLK